MQDRRSWIGIAGHTGIVARVFSGGFQDGECRFLRWQIGGDVQPTITIIIYHAIIEIPKYKFWCSWTWFQDAIQFNAAANFGILFTRTDDLSSRLWTVKKNKYYLNNQMEHSTVFIWQNLFLWKLYDSPLKSKVKIFKYFG